MGRLSCNSKDLLSGGQLKTFRSSQGGNYFWLMHGLKTKINDKRLDKQITTLFIFCD